MCCFLPFFFFFFYPLSGAGIHFDTQCNIWSRQMRGRTEEFELELTPRHAGRHGAHQSQPRALGWTHQVCLDIGRILSVKKHSWAGRREAIWDIDNEINTEEQTKGTAVCTQCDCFNSLRTSREGKKNTYTHRSWKDIVLYLSGCISVGSFHFILTAKARQTEITTTEIWCLNWEERSVVPLFCLFVLKTGLAAESTSLSEYKRCLRGNISEVLCWWLTVWQTSGVKLQLRSVRKKKRMKEKKNTWVMCKRKRGGKKRGFKNWGSERTKKKLIYIL